MKKGEMSINMIIMACIGIIILVIIVFLLVKHFNNTDDAASCPSSGGICLSAEACSSPIVIDNAAPECKLQGEICCKPIA